MKAKTHPARLRPPPSLRLRRKEGFENFKLLNNWLTTKYNRSPSLHRRWITGGPAQRRSGVVASFQTQCSCKTKHVMGSGKILRNSEEEWQPFNHQCHAELVSVPHMLSILHASHLSCGIPKQVRDDFRFSTCDGEPVEPKLAKALPHDSSKGPYWYLN